MTCRSCGDDNNHEFNGWLTLAIIVGLILFAIAILPVFMYYAGLWYDYWGAR